MSLSLSILILFDRQGRQIEIHYDGWSEEFNQWVDDDSPDIHPCGWAAKTGHALQGPLTPQVAVFPFLCL